MPGARISFTCDTGEDADVILWLDSFGSRERGFAIKAAIRDYIAREIDTSSETNRDINIDQLTQIEEKISDIFREVVKLRRQGLAISINNDIINNDLQRGELDPETESNIDKLLLD